MSKKQAASEQRKRVRRIARERFGYKRLRAGQEEAICAVLAGRDTLAVLPSGAGKSAIYQICGLLLTGETVVVSPLIALQRDQAESLTDVDGGGAAEINSALSESARDETFADLQHEKIEFLFLAPEQFENEETMAAVRAARPSLFVVDEAHCISEWGYDFRPDYLKLGAVIEELGHPTTLALTATAAPPVRQEIVERLSMADPAVVIRGFDRPNIHLAVRLVPDEDDKREALIAQVVVSEKPGIVYAATRRATEELAALLIERGCSAAAYHAGLSASVRDQVQDDFLSGDIEVIVATIAFGMGIDKPDVRFVYHADVSESVDTYYQEIGRAGRDGVPAGAVLFYRPDDLNLRRFQSGMGQLDLSETERIVDAVLAADEPVEVPALQDATSMTETKLMRALRRLEESGAVKLLPDGAVAPRDTEIDAGEAAAAAVATQREVSLFAQSRVEMMRQYAESGGCRRAFILNYFGEVAAQRCGNCDNCDAGRSGERAVAVEPFPVSSHVTHATWGSGQVMRYEGTTVTVLFDTVGYRTLSLDVVQEEHLLSPEGEQ